MALYLRDSFTCAYCGRDLHAADPAELTLDHLTPRSQGGSHDASNLVTACRSCNSARADRVSWRRYATGGAVERIERLRRRGIVKFQRLAAAILSGDLERSAAVEAVRAV